MLKVRKVGKDKRCVGFYGIRNLTFYKCGRYEIRAELREGDEKAWTIYTVNPREKDTYFVPRIYHHNDLNGKELGFFEIQTTSYGALDVEQYDVFLKNCEHAFKVAKALNEYFCKEDENDGK